MPAANVCDVPLFSFRRRGELLHVAVEPGWRE